ncbi:MAG: S8 family serine peptidase, partial [Bacteroidota bacterium]
DTDGHGTHVAAIAAGNGMNPSLIGEPDFDRAGIAPEAEIIAVNLLDSEDSTVSDVIKFRDALVYIIEKARVSSPDKAVVINMSFGVSLGAHDGRGDEGDNTDEEVINEVFHEKEGVIGIAAAGNESGIFQHLEITLKGTSPDNIIKIPFFVERNQGYEQDGSSLYIDMWYGIDDNPGVKLWFKPPGGVLSNPSILEGADVVGDFNNGKCEFGIEHTKKESLSDLRGNVTRANIEIYISPKKRKLQLGDGYQLLVSGKENTKIHLWVNPDPNFRINFDKSLIDVEDGVEISDRSTISSPGHCPEIITVGSFEKDRNRLSCFSSRGPVLSYTSSGPIAEKPDVVAPGKQISSAKAEACKCGRGWLYDTYIRFNGTSMSAPHVAGMVALMLEKNNKLKLEKIKEHLKSASEDGGLKYIETDICGNRDDGIETNSSSPIVGKTEVGLGRVNVKATVDLVS